MPHKEFLNILNETDIQYNKFNEICLPYNTFFFAFNTQFLEEFGISCPMHGRPKYIGVFVSKYNDNIDFSLVYENQLYSGYRILTSVVDLDGDIHKFLEKVKNVYNDFIANLFKIVINTLFYINNIDQDYEVKSVNKIKNYFNKYNKVKPNKIHKAYNITVIGQRLKKYYESEVNRTGVRTIKPHWRRGHIRRFKHPKYKKEWTFVKPTLVKRKDYTEEKVRIYNVNLDPASS